MERTLLFLMLTLLQQLCTRVAGHGRLYDPPSRSSRWRLGFESPPNYNDNELNCGGFSNQWSRQGGRCGVCGDPYQQTIPRANERGGRYGASSHTVRSYTEGSIVNITIQVTANHKGWFEVRICPTNDKNVRATVECFDQYLLPLADGSGTRYNLPQGNQMFTYSVQLPRGLTCDWCVLQWKWHCGNNWGTSSDGRGCVGCGAQEQFYGCADIAITPADGSYPTQKVPEATSPETRRTYPEPQGPRGDPTPERPKGYPTPERPRSYPPPQAPRVSSKAPQTPLVTLTYPRVQPEAATTPATRQGDADTTVTSRRGSNPRATQGPADPNAPEVDPSSACCSHDLQPGLDTWCRNNCAAGFCPPSHCRCGPGCRIPSAKRPPSPGDNAIQVAPMYKGVPGMLMWCKRNCRRGFCPSSHCIRNR